MAGNLLSTIPEQVFLVSTALEEVDLSNNKLTSLPESFGELKKLKAFSVNQNQLTSLPTNLPWTILRGTSFIMASF
jgi:Leucine-rich repeat (LRR) protein